MRGRLLPTAAVAPCQTPRAYPGRSLRPGLGLAGHSGPPRLWAQLSAPRSCHHPEICFAILLVTAASAPAPSPALSLCDSLGAGVGDRGQGLGTPRAEPASPPAVPSAGPGQPALGCPLFSPRRGAAQGTLILSGNSACWRGGRRPRAPSRTLGRQLPARLRRRRVAGDQATTCTCAVQTSGRWPARPGATRPHAPGRDGPTRAPGRCRRAGSRRAPTGTAFCDGGARPPP